MNAAISPALDSLSTPIAWFDDQAQLLGCNPAFASWLGVSARRLLGMSLDALDAEGERLRALLARVPDAGAPLRVHRARLAFPGGGERFAELWLSRLPAGGVCVEAHPADEFPGEDPATALPAALSAALKGLAHEIRNPLAAIAQANELMEEDLKEPGLKQLSSLVRKNAQRLQQIVEEILDISRARHGVGGTSEMLALDAQVSSACNDWAMQTRSGSRLQLSLAAAGVSVRFDTDHLRRVLVNLLDNALRYAGERPDSIRVFTRVTGAQASLHVWSDGAPLEPSVQRHLFEPFFSSESRSSGLGLYICRELCERHGAAMAYERAAAGSASNARDGNEFVVLFARGAAPAPGQASFDTITA